MTGEPTHTASKKEIALRASAINYHLKSEVSIMLHCQLCSTCCTALQIKNCSKNTSVIKVATMKNMGQFPLQREAIMRYLLPNHWHLLLSAKVNGT